MQFGRFVISAAAAGLVAAAALAAPAAVAVPASGGTASAAGMTSVSGPLPRAVFSTSLHAQFTGLLGHVTAGPRAGIVPPLRPLGSKPAATSPSTGQQPTCIEPNCDLQYNKGRVQHNPRVYVVFWGPTWKTSTSEIATQKYLLAFYNGLGAKGDTWSQTTMQYGDTTGHPAFPGASTGVFVQYGIDTSAPPAKITEANLAAEATVAATKFGITKDVPDAQVVVATQSGGCFADGFAGNTCTGAGSADYCAWHSSTAYDGGQLSYTNLPYQLDAGPVCGENFVNNGSAGTLDGFSIVGGHEYAESITDPVLGSGWLDNSDNVSGGEVADKCAWGGELWLTLDPFGDVTLTTGSFAMQSLWSNATGGCVMSGKLPLKVTPLANRAGTIGHAVSVQVRASASPGSRALTYSAAGLPAGVSINRSTGLIHGTVSGAVKVYTVKVTVAYYDGSSSFEFTWTIDAVGQVTGAWGKCLDNANGKTAAGNKVDIFSCNGKAQQKITYTPGGQLRVQNGCVTGGLVSAFFEPCSGATNKVWTRVGSEYVSKATGKCLTDPGNAKLNGTRLTLATCTGKVYQKWTLP